MPKVEGIASVNIDRYMYVQWKPEPWIIWETAEQGILSMLTSASPKHGLGEFKTVIQALDYVLGLHNFREFSQPSEMSEAM